MNERKSCRQVLGIRDAEHEAGCKRHAKEGEVIFGAMTVLSTDSSNRLPVKTLAPENIQETVAVSQNMTISNLLLNLSLKASSK